MALPGSSTTSDMRDTVVRCEHADRCGGCPILSLPYGEQLLVKYIDGNVRDDAGKVNHPKHTESWYRTIVRDTGKRLEVRQAPPVVTPAVKPAPKAKPVGDPRRG